MKGLELSQQYFDEIGRPILEQQLGQKWSRVAAGLVGEGSECFGFDDDISRDHDWGPSFCMWLTKQDYEDFGSELQAAYKRLPQSFMSYPPRFQSFHGGGRVGVFPIGLFYARFIGLERAPENIREWQSLPESHLAVVTNGKVFCDPVGEFSSIREKLLAFYPEDLRIRKIAARAFTMGQSGQYNYSRCLRHGEPVAAEIALTKFMEASISMIHLLNRRYTPYYKWSHRSLQNLPLLSKTSVLFEELAENIANQRKIQIIEEISSTVIRELRNQGLSSETSDFLPDHCLGIMQHIQDSSMRRMDV